MTMQDTLNKIADNIEQNGHFQGDPRAVPQSAVCVYINPAWPRVGQGLALIEIAKRAGFEPKVREGYLNWNGLYDWNDSTPTEQVLATLRGQA